MPKSDKKTGAGRWWIAGLLAAAMLLNYLDRQSLPLAVGEIRKDFEIGNAAYARLQSYFLFGYGVMYAGGGRLVDYTGTRIGFLLIMLWWSGATALHGFARSVTHLEIFRLLLGLGEGGSFPAAAKAVSERFNAAERSFAVGLYNTGSGVGAMIAPPLIAALVLAGGWRVTFWVAGAAGLVWTVGWALSTRAPAAPPVAAAPRPSWLALFRLRPVRGLVLAKFLSDSAWYFLILWLPRYLGDVRGLQMSGIGAWAWIPFAFAGLGSFLGGSSGSVLIARGATVEESRRRTLLFSACLLPATMGIVSAPLGWAIACYSAAAFGHQYWATILQTLPTDLFPPHLVGSVAGIMGAAGAFGGVLFNLLAGRMIDSFHSYGPIFALAGILHLTSYGLLRMFVRPSDFQ
jgi:MFS transporter, ACS family, hexuronate transporter